MQLYDLTFTSLSDDVYVSYMEIPKNSVRSRVQGKSATVRPLDFYLENKSSHFLTVTNPSIILYDFS